MSLLEEMTQLGARAKESSRALARLTTEEKNRCLMAMAEALEKNRDAIRRENEKDMKAAKDELRGIYLVWGELVTQFK